MFPSIVLLLVATAHRAIGEASALAPGAPPWPSAPPGAVASAGSTVPAAARQPPHNHTGSGGPAHRRHLQQHLTPAHTMEEDDGSMLGAKRSRRLLQEPVSAPAPSRAPAAPAPAAPAPAAPVPAAPAPAQQGAPPTAHSPPPPQIPPPATARTLGPPSHTCTLVMAGGSPGEPPAPASALWRLSLACTGGARGDLEVRLSPWLHSAAAGGSANTPDVSLSGVSLSAEPISSTAPPGEPPAGDWRVVLVCGPGVNHLQLADSSISDLPLSPLGPVLQLVGCGAVSLTNVTLTRLAAAAAAEGTSPASLPVYGAVHAAGLRQGALVRDSECSHVEGAHIWACLLLSFADDPADANERSAARVVEVRGSTLHSNSVAADGVEELDASLLLPEVAAALLPAANQQSCGGAYGAVVVSSGGVVDVVVANSTMDNNTGGCGGALAALCPTGSLHLTAGSSLSGCSALLDGGALYAGGRVGALSLSGASSLTGNTAGRNGGAVAAAGGVGRLVLDGGSRVSGNSCGQSGGGILVEMGALGSVVLASGSALVGNTAGARGGAVAVASGGIGEFVVTDSGDVSYNTALAEGGAVWCNGPLQRLLLDGNSSLSHNAVSANNSMGGAISILGSAETVVIQGGSILANNSADQWGGAIAITNGNLLSFTVNGSLVHGNRGGYGAAVQVDEETRSVKIVGGSSVSYNQARPGISGRGGFGGVLLSFGRIGSITIDQRSAVEYNSAALQGGAFLSNGGLGTLSVQGGSSVSYNTALMEGGAVRCSGPLQQLLLDGNSSLSHNAVSANNSLGGAVSIGGDVESIIFQGGSTVANNSADLWGGAVVVGGGNLLSFIVNGSLVHGNRGGYGAALFVNEELLSVQIAGGSNVSYNQARPGISARGGLGGVLLSSGRIGGIAIDQRSAVEYNSATMWGGAFAGNGGLETLTVQGGSSMSYNTALMEGGAVWSSGPLQLLLLDGNSSLSHNAVSANNSLGGAVSIRGDVTALTIQGGSVVAHNSADLWGGAIVVAGGGGFTELLINGSSILGNRAGFGGVIHIDGKAELVRIVGGSRISYNVARIADEGKGRGGLGGFLHAVTLVDNITIDQGSFVEYNSAELFGGAITCAAGLTSFTVKGGASLSHNLSGRPGGGGLAVMNGNCSSMTLSGAVVRNNSAQPNGGAIAVGMGGSLGRLLVDNATLVEGNSANAGGFLYVEGNTQSLVVTGGSTLVRNMANRTMSGNSLGIGGVFYCWAFVDEVLFSQASNASYNSAMVRGGVIYAGGGLGTLTCEKGSTLSLNQAATAEGSGGVAGVWGNVSLLHLTSSCQLVSNTAGYQGGAVYVGGGLVSQLLVEAGSLVARNRARFGGVVYVDQGLGSIRVSASNVVDNVAAGEGTGGDGGGSGGYGGVLYSADGMSGVLAIVSNSSVTRNTAAVDGGVAYIQGPLGGLRVAGGSTVAVNKAIGGRGGVLAVGADAGSLEVAARSIVTRNTAGADGGVASVLGATGVLTVSDGSLVDLNVATLGHGGVLASGMGLLRVAVSNGSSMSQNRAGMNGGAIRSGHYWAWRDQGQPTELALDSSSVLGNTAGRSGGVWSHVGDVGVVALTAAAVSQNLAGAGYGGAFDVRGSVGSVLLQNRTVVSGNRAGVMGGFLSVSAPDGLTGAVLRNLTLLDGSSIVGNAAGQLGGAIAAPLVANFALLGGSTLSNNSATAGAGGAIAEQAAMDSSTSLAWSCRLLPSSSSWLLGGGSTVAGNTAGGPSTGMGGAFLVAMLGSCDAEGRPRMPLFSRHIALTGIALQENRAGGGGGAVAVRGPSGSEAAGWPVGHVSMAMEQCEVRGNSAGRLAAVAAEDWSSLGGAVLMWGQQQQQPSVLAPGVGTIGGNATAAAVGGDAALVAPVCRVSLGQGSLVQGNTASGHGGAAALGGCSLHAGGATLGSNTAGGGGGAAAVLPSGEATLPNVKLTVSEAVLRDGTLSGTATACPTAPGYTALKGADASPSANLARSPLYGTTGELAAACDADPSCLAFSSNGFVGHLKGATFLEANASLLSTEGPEAGSLCLYVKFTGRSSATSCPLFAGFVTLAGMDHPGDDIGAGGREEGDTTLSVAQSCALDAACQGFSSRSAMKYRALPAAQAEDTGTCLYVKQTGACPHVAGFAAVWSVDGAGRAAERQTTAYDVSALAAQCDTASGCSAFSSEGWVVDNRTSGSLEYNIASCLYLRLGQGETPADQAPASEVSPPAPAQPIEHGLPDGNQQLPWLDIHNTSFEGNRAQNGSGGAIWFEEPPASSGREAWPSGPSSRRLLLQTGSGGPALSVRLSNSSFGSNTAAAGGGGGCSLTLRNGAGQGGSGYGTGSLLAVSSCNFTSNAALAAEGGGLRVAAPDSGVLLEPSYMLGISGVLLSSNRAASGGGGLSLSGPLAVAMEDTFVVGNAAAGGAGGGVAARGCLALSLIHSNVSGNSAPAGSGGGVFAGGCGRVYMREASVEGNRALAGGGLHLSSEEGLPGGAGAVDGAGTAAMIVQTRVYGNAASQDLGLATGAAAGVQGRGGGLYVTGAVGVVIFGGDFSGGNQGRIGSTIATTQTCMPQRTSPGGNTAPGPPPPGAPSPEPREVVPNVNSTIPDALVGPWLAVLEGIMRRSSCYPLALLGATRLPRSGGNSGASPVGQGRYELWTQDALHSAVYANCSSSSTADPGQAAVSPAALEQLQAWLDTIGGNSNNATSNGTTASQRYISLMQALSRCVADTGMDASLPETMTGSDILSQQPKYMQLRSSKQPLTWPSGLAGGSVVKASADAGSSSRVYDTVADGFYYNPYGDGNMAGAGQPPDRKLRLRVGAPFDVTVQLYDVVGLPVTADVTPVDITLAIIAGPPPPAMESAAPGAPNGTGPPSNATTGSGASSGGGPVGSWPSNSSLATLDPGLIAGRSLTQRVQGGTATWSQVVARGWPGEYRLLFTAAASGPLAELMAPVESLAVSVELLPCAVGEALEPSSSSQGALPSWTRCQPCGQEQLGLWRDTRPRLSAVGSNSSSNSGSLEDVQSDMAMIVEQLLDRANSKRAAVCRTCPPMAQCPGGAVVVPLPGWWHSAANSTAMHRCPYAPACGRGAKEDQVSLWRQRQQYYEVHAPANTNASSTATAQDNIPFGSDARSAALAWCQAEWYASSWRPGAAVVAAAVSDRLLPEGLDTAGIMHVDMPASPPSSNGTAAAAPPCLLWYEAALMPSMDPAAFDVLSYTQLQCAVSYTGTLCAACEPGYYGGARFQCADCATVLRTACLGLLAFLGSFIVVLVTAYATLLVDYTASATERMAGSAELLKALILHVQQFVIVTRPPVDYPRSIVAATSIFSALTWAGDWWGFSPACLLPNQDSGGQARLLMAGGVLAPCLVMLASMAAWAVRYCCFRQPQDPPELPQRVSQVVEFHDLTGNPAPSHTTTVPAPGPATAPCHQGSAIQLAVYPGGSSEETVLVLASQSSTARDAAGSSSAAQQRAAPPPPPVLEGPPAAEPARAAAPPHVDLSRAAEVGHARTPLVTATSSAQLDRRQSNSSARWTSAFAKAATLLDTAVHSRPEHSHSGMLQEDRRTSLYTEASQLSTTSKFSEAFMSKALRLRSVTTSTLSVAGQKLSRLVPTPKPNSALAHADRSLSLVSQLGIVMWVAVFVLYPSWVQAALSVFACYIIDDGSGPYGDNQQATWRHGYWVRDMAQQCYTGVHLSTYVPVGVVSFIVFCLAPPLATFLVLWRVRHKGGTARGAPDPLQHDPHTLQVYGFLYTRYRPRYWWWESMLQLQTLCLVAAEVFGRALPVLHQALLLLCVLLITAVVNMACAPVRSRLLVVLEFMSFSVLAVTITLGLYFVGEEPVGAVPADLIGALILAANAAMMAAFAMLLGRRLWPAARRLVGSWVRAPAWYHRWKEGRTADDLVISDK